MERHSAQQRELVQLGRHHFSHKDYARAEQLLLEALDAGEQYADVHHMLGVMAHERGDFERAERFLREAVALNPGYTEALLALAVVVNDQGRYDEARAHLAAARSRAPGPDEFALGKIANMHAATAQAYLDAGLLGEAIVELERAVALRPRFADLQTRLAILRRESGDRDGAQAALRAACENNPRYLPARLALAGMLLASGDLAGADREVEVALALDPENRTAEAYRRMIVRRRGGDPGPMLRR